MGKTNQKYQNGMTQPSRKLVFKQEISPNRSCNSSVLYKLIGKSNYLFHPIEGISALSFCKPHPANLQGSMTVEAAIALPLFLFFFLNLLWIIEIYNFHGTLQMALRECGRELSIYAYAYDRVVEEDEDTGLEALLEDVAFSYLYVQGQVEKQMGEAYLDRAPVAEGKKGLVYANSSILQQKDIVDLVVSYRAKPLISLIGFSPKWFYARYYGRAWTGYDVSQNGNEETTDILVYVTENGRVYHVDRECSHIRLSIQETNIYDMEGLRNEGGERYRPCELCIDGPVELIYITSDGNRYHQTRECSGLKRTVYSIPKSQAEEVFRQCLRCGLKN